MRSMRRRTELMFQVATENVMRGSRRTRPHARPAPGGARRPRQLPTSRASSLAAVARLVGRQFVDMEQRRIRLRGQIDIGQGDDCLEALGVDHRPLPQRIGRGVENERQMRRAAERRLVLDLDGDRIALLRDAKDPGVAGEVDVIGEQELERRLADEIFILGVELAVDDGEAAAVGDDLESRPCEFESAPGARGSASPPTAVRPARSERSRRSRPAPRRARRWRAPPLRSRASAPRTLPIWAALPTLSGRAAPAGPKRRRPRVGRARRQALAIGSGSPRMSNPCRYVGGANRRSARRDNGKYPAATEAGAFRNHCALSMAGARPSRGYVRPARAASSESPRRSTIMSISDGLTMKGGARRTWSPSTPSIVPPIG